MKENRIAVVTGAASVIGLASSGRLAADGFTVVLLDRSDQVTACAEALRDSGFKADSVVGDLTEPATIQAVPRFLQEGYGRCDVLVNNAGVATRAPGKEPSFQELSRDDWEYVIAVNLTAPFLLSQAVFR